MDEIEKTIGTILSNKRMTLGVIESATGGLISHRITNVAGSSDYYKGSITAYSNEIKNRIVGVKAETLEIYGSVSARTAEELASGGKRVLEVDICIADTGIAGNKHDFFAAVAGPFKTGDQAVNLFIPPVEFLRNLELTGKILGTRLEIGIFYSGFKPTKASFQVMAQAIGALITILGRFRQQLEDNS